MTKPIVAPFTYKNLTLSLLDFDDLPDTMAWRNANPAGFNDTRTLTLNSHTAWYHQYLLKNNDLVFLVKNIQEDKIGQVAVYNIDWDEHTGEFGRFMVNPEFAGQKFMQTACEAMLALSHQILHLHTLHLEVRPENAKAIHIYQKCGFSTSGIQPNQNIRMEYHEHCHHPEHV